MNFINTETLDTVDFYDDPAFLDNPNGLKIENLRFQTLPPLDLAPRPCKYVDGKLITVPFHEDQVLDFESLVKISPSPAKLDLNACKGNNGFHKIYLNRIVPYDENREYAEKVYVRILGAQFKTELFAKHAKPENIGGGTKVSACLKVVKADAVMNNIEELDLIVENNIHKYPGYEKVVIRPSLKFYEGEEDDPEADQYHDFWINWNFTKTIDVRIDGKLMKLNYEQVNAKCQNSWIDITMAVDPWMREKDGVRSAGLNYYAVHLDVRTFKKPDEKKMGIKRKNTKPHE